MWKARNLIIPDSHRLPQLPREHDMENQHQGKRKFITRKNLCRYRIERMYIEIS